MGAITKILLNLVTLLAAKIWWIQVDRVPMSDYMADAFVFPLLTILCIYTLQIFTDAGQYVIRFGSSDPISKTGPASVVKIAHQINGT